MDQEGATKPVFTTVRRFIKTGIGFLILGLILGGYLIIQRELLNQFPDPHLVSAHAHAVQLGFVMFVILGVALWLFPRASKDDSRYKPQVIETSYWVLTLATASRFAAEASRAWSDHTVLRWIVVIGGLGQILGIMLYFSSMWWRIRALGSIIRERAGERF